MLAGTSAEITVPAQGNSLDKPAVPLGMPGPFSEAQRQGFLAAKHVGVLSVAAADDRPPASVPIWYCVAVGWIAAASTRVVVADEEMAVETVEQGMMDAVPPEAEAGYREAVRREYAAFCEKEKKP